MHEDDESVFAARAGRRARLPRQGRAADRAAARDPRGGRRRRRVRPGDRRRMVDFFAAAAQAAASARRSRTSRAASARSSTSSPAGAPTQQIAEQLVPRPPRPCATTSRASSPSSRSSIARRPSSRRAKPASAGDEHVARRRAARRRPSAPQPQRLGVPAPRRRGRRARGGRRSCSLVLIARAGVPAGDVRRCRSSSYADRCRRRRCLLLGALMLAHVPRHPIGWILCARRPRHRCCVRRRPRTPSTRTTSHAAPGLRVGRLGRRVGVGADRARPRASRCCCSPTGAPPSPPLAPVRSGAASRRPCSSRSKARSASATTSTSSATRSYRRRDRDGRRRRRSASAGS